MEASRPLALGGLAAGVASRSNRRARRTAEPRSSTTRPGKVASPAQWFDDRAAGAAARPLLARAAGVRAARPVRAVAYAQLRPGEMKAVGLAADAAAWPRLPEPSDCASARARRLAGGRSRWRQTLERIGDGSARRPRRRRAARRDRHVPAMRAAVAVPDRRHWRRWRRRRTAMPERIAMPRSSSRERCRGAGARARRRAIVSRPGAGRIGQDRAPDPALPRAAAHASSVRKRSSR